MKKVITTSVLLCLSAMFCSPLSFADEEKDANEKVVENYIPGMWEPLYIEDALLEPHIGENVRRVCYGDEIDENPDVFKQISVRNVALRRSGRAGSWQSSGSSIGLNRYRLMDGGRDFVVVGENVVVFDTPETDTHIVTFKKGCRKQLNYAQHMIFSDNRPRKSRQRCLSSSGGVLLTIRNLLTPDGGVSSSKASTREMFSCQIDEIFKWEGDQNLPDLIAASLAQRAENQTDDAKTEDQ